MRKEEKLKISVVIPMYNVSKILMQVLNSVKAQNYPIEEILIIDNKSSDNSLNVAKKFKKNNKNLDIKIIKRDKTYGVSSSYNSGARLAKGDYIVSVHSDSALPTKKELSKLISPFLSDDSIVATYPIVLHPRDVWLAYNFWQKCLFATVVEKYLPSMSGKFDCYKKNIFLKIGGYNEKRFDHHLGTEDADMHHRLNKIGKVIATDARVIHLHGNEKEYSLKDWVARRKFLAKSYGGNMRLHLKDMGGDAIYFFVKPFFAVLGVLGLLNPLFFLPVVIFPFVYMKNMFAHKETLTDIRILTLPFIIIFLNYFETYWLIRGLFLKRT